MAKRLYLLDGMALVYRAHFAFITRPILDSSGRNTSAVFGFTNTLLELLEKREPTHIAVAFDTSAPTARHELYPEYKAQRDEMPEELAAAIPQVKKLLQAFRIPVLELDGYEADDIIGTLARQAEKDGYEETFMVTPDKDYAQLVDEHTFMYKPGRKGGEVEILGVDEIREQWGIDRPEQVIDILGLMGDSSDNIPGVPGVGPKTAQKLIAQFGSVDALLDQVEDVKGKMREKISENAEQAKLSRKLVVIDCQVPLDKGPDDLVRGERDDEKLRQLFAELEFNTIGKRVFGDGFSAPPTGGDLQGDLFETSATPVSTLKTCSDTSTSYRCVEDPQALQELLQRLLDAKEVCFDLETGSLDTLSTEIVGIAFSIGKGEGDYVSVTADNEAEVLTALRPFWNSGLLKVGHNLKFDLAVLLAKGVQVQGPFADTMIAHSLVEPDQRHSMDRLAAALLGYEPIPITDLLGPKGKNQKSMRDLPVKEVVDYACEDADITLQLWHALSPEVEKSGQQQVFSELEMQVLPVLMRMEHEGIRLDTEALSTLSERLGARLGELEALIKEAAGHDFNLNSPKQLGVVLFDELKLSEKPKKTKTGQYKTDEQTLQSLAGAHPAIDAILEYRELGKLKSTYVDALPKEVHPDTGRVHTQYLQTGAATGRLSSNHPNLQNIPIRTEQGREIRRAFIPRSDDFLLLAADYSQVELRLMAHMSGDEGMQQAFRDGLDIHQATAAKVYGVELDGVTGEMRRKAKMVNFGIIYGISAFGLSQRLDIPRQEAAEIIEAYFTQYPGVKAFMEKTVEEARAKGYVETLCGRRRGIRDIDSRNRMVREAAERTAINTPIQGSAADMIKRAMITVDDLLRTGEARTRLLLQVHDELVFDLHRDEQETWIPKIVTAMEEAMPLDVPVVVDTGVGQNWLEAH
jgi:DNA polymerase-1